MIDSLEINDFQSHKLTKLIFDSGYNVIVGSSGVGKTAIIRALKYLFTNKPTGMAFLRRPDGSTVKVSASVEKSIIERIRAKSINTYKLDTNTWQDFGTHVPELILNTIKIHPVVFDDNLEFDLQFASQFDAPFMIVEPDSVKVKFINRLSGTHIIDLARRDLTLEIRNLNNDLEDVNTQLQSKEDILKDCGKLQALDISIEKFDKDLEYYEKLSAKASRLSDIKSKLDIFNDRLVSYNKYSIIKSRINIDTFIEKLSIYENLKSIKHRILDIDSKLIDVNRLSAINKEGIISLENRIKRLEQLKQLKTKLVSIEDSLKNNKNTVDKLNCKMLELKDEYKNTLLVSKICPTCNQPITDSCINNILEE